MPGIYIRPGEGYLAGFQVNGRWTMQKLTATSLTEAKRERASLLAGIREGRVAAKDDATFAAVFIEYQNARNLSERHAGSRAVPPRPAPGEMKGRKVQDIAPSDVAQALQGMRDTRGGHAARSTDS